MQLAVTADSLGWDSLLARRAPPAWLDSLAALIETPAAVDAELATSQKFDPAVTAPLTEKILNAAGPEAAINAVDYAVRNATRALVAARTNRGVGSAPSSMGTRCCNRWTTSS